MNTRERSTPKALYGFPRQARITRGAELQRIAREGKRIRTAHIEVRVAVSPLVHPPASRHYHGIRIGLIVPRFKHSAVARNRLKRRIRELARLQMLPTQITADLVIRIRPEAYSASFDQLTADVLRAMEYLHQWQIVRATTSDDERP